MLQGSIGTKPRKWLLLFLLVGTLLLWIGSHPAAGQVAEVLIVTINQVDDSLYPQVQVLTSVTDQGGIPVEGLTDSNFSLFQDGDPVSNLEVAPVDMSQQAISIVLLIDTSGSMNDVDSSGGSALGVAKEAAISFVNSLNMPLDQVSVISFNSNVIQLQPFSSDVEALTQTIENLTAEGETRLYDAAFDSVELAASLPPGRKAIVLLTDGQDTESRLTDDDVKEKAEEIGIPIYTIGLGPEVDQLSLERLATLSGGRYLEAPLISDIIASFEVLSEQLRQQYVITFESDLPADDRRHTLGLSVKNDERTGSDASSYVARSRPGNVVISIPESGDVLTGQAVISPTLNMVGKVIQVSFLVDSKLQETKLNSPFTFLWDTTQVESGEHTIEVIAVDHVGNEAQSSTTVMVSAPATSTSEAPTLVANISNPKDQEKITEPTLLTIEVDDTSKEISRVEFWVNDELLDSVQLPPYETFWDVTPLEPGSYSVTALVFDNEGNQSEDTVLVYVDPSPVLLANFNGLVPFGVYLEPTQLVVSIEKTTHGVEKVEYLDNGNVFAVDNDPPYQVTWNADGVAQGEHTISARVYDAKGNLWEDDVKVFVSQNRGDSYWLIILVGGGLIIVILFIVFLQQRGFGALIPRRRPVVQSAEADFYLPARKLKADKLTSSIEENNVDGTTETLVIDQGVRTTDPDQQVFVEDSVDESASHEPMPEVITEPAPVVEEPESKKTGILAYLSFVQVATGQKQEFPLSEATNRVRIGRAKDVDIILYDAKVSRYHAEIYKKYDEFIFIDNQPTNPSYINGKIFRGPHTIRDGDEFIVGETKMLFRLI